MKERALSLIKDIESPAEKLNILREYIQTLVLRSLHESEAFLNLSFVGGTALRFVYNLPRFSEDLDFSLEMKKGYTPEVWMKKIKTDLALAGFHITITWNGTRVVHKAWIKVVGLLQEAGLAAMKNQNLSIKFEIDTKPPLGARCLKTILTNYVTFSVRHHDLPSLMAGKLNALLTRQYAKGRDWYDLLWYRGQRPSVDPNLEQLQHALDQFHDLGRLVASEWKDYIINQLSLLDCHELIEDVAPFLEHPQDAELITRENLALAVNS